MRLAWFLFLMLLVLPLAGRAQQSTGTLDTESIDSAIRSGDLSAAWDRFTRQYVDAHADNDIKDQMVLLHRGMEICLMMNYPYLADRLFMRAKDLGFLRDPEWRIPGFLMKARIQFTFGNYDQVRLLLDKAANFVNANTSQEDLAMLFAHRALYTWLTHQHSAANEYVEAVLLSNAEENIAYPRAIALLVLALMVDERSDEGNLIASNLEFSRQAMADDGRPIAFYALLGQILALHPGTSIRSVSSQVLEYAQRGDRYDNSWIASRALISRAELQRRSGSFGTAIDLLQRAGGLEQLAHQESESLELEWRLLTNGLTTIRPMVESPKFPIQWVIFTMLLVLFMLILLLRIHTQRIINEKLVESVEKSRLAEQAAEHANRLKSQFVANVSHEIKTPMSGLVGMTSLLEELIADPVQKKYLATIRQCSNNLLVLMNDLLDLGRIDANKLEIDKHPHNTREIFSYCENIVQLPAREKGLDLRVEIDESVPEIVIVDSTRVSQILVNLLNNAIKFTSEGSVSMTATFDAAPAGAGNLIVAVEDTGRGIEPDRLQTVFEPFNQQAAQDHSDELGSGLGLAICKRLTDHMGGTLKVHSQFAKGSRFILSLPVSVPAE